FGVELVPDIHEPGNRSHDLARQLALEVDVEPVIARFLKVLRVPEQGGAAAAYVRSIVPADDRDEGVGRRWVRVRDGLLGHALNQPLRVLVTLHAEERRLEEAYCFKPGNGSLAEGHLCRYEVSCITHPQRGPVVDLDSRAEARRQSELRRIPHAGVPVVRP